MWGVEHRDAAGSGLSGGSGQPPCSSDFAMGGRNQKFEPMEDEEAFGRKEDFIDGVGMHVQGGMEDVGDGNVAHAGNRGLLHRRPERVGGGRPRVIRRSWAEPLIHEISKDSISEEEDSYSIEEKLTMRKLMS